jgi:CysZ protein
MTNDFLSGANYFLRGIKLVVQPKLRRFILAPLIINTLVFTTAIWLGINRFDALKDQLLPQGSSWWIEIAGAVMWVFFAAVVLLILFFTFTVAANIIGAPFNGLLSEKVEGYISGEQLRNSGGIREIFSSIPKSVLSELKKILYFLFLGMLVLILLLIPGAGIISPIVWALFTSWMLALEYIAYPMENHGLFFSQARKELRKKRMLAFGFGIAVMIVTMTPVVNFLVMPAAVAGATVMWADRFQNQHKD